MGSWWSALEVLLAPHRGGQNNITAALTAGCASPCSLRALLILRKVNLAGVSWVLRAAAPLPAVPLEQLSERPEAREALLSTSTVTLLFRRLVLSSGRTAVESSRVFALYTPPLFVWGSFIKGLDQTEQRAAVEVFSSLVTEGMPVSEALVSAPLLVR
jgi:hypothetical protein